jgi:hypothetical protein
MADAKISELSPAGALTGTELVELVQSGSNVRSTVSGVGAAAVATHEADTTSVHGIANTANLYASGGTDVAIADGGTGQSTASAAFGALKQDATTTATGVSELATSAEAITGTDTTRAVTVAALKAFVADRRMAAFTKPSGALRETFNRAGSACANLGALASGTVFMSAVELHEGDTVTSITFMSATTAGSNMTHQWFGLYDTALNRLAQSADDTSTAWAANSPKTLNMGTPYPVTASGMYYIAILVTQSGGAVPSVAGLNAGVANFTWGLAPILTGTSSTAQTTLPNPAGAVTVTANRLWAYCS